MVVGPSLVAHYGEFKVFSLIQFSSVGLNMINHFKHVYPWRWIWLSDSIFINAVVIIILGALNKVGSLGGSFLALAYFVEMSNFMTGLALGILSWALLSWLVFLFSTSHALILHLWGFSRLMTRIRRSLYLYSCPCSASGHMQENLWMYWNLPGIDSCGECCNLLFPTVALEIPL